ncbi:UDP-2,3-diacylglucosamine diphosphatase [Thalassotalea sp. 1_MG-2023]|uniref:UDP-2,3-diacylglucosamine diphosphatase n=1 Tax=Thalassotalea sp. 1_MG-2023 TaxID=3062680 RepID=UPI0026E355FB|nr:UDP-2,3-diacylglucosamine diphosphatase [Thalassotalea sp. 1_MG-2023]MDO6427975.1 UDP-2,3-diacylglucosamine diphosphatase [Thalassotalea sp. 1_MG-2023]
MSNITYFIADLHLAEDRPDITACFLSFLKKDAPKAQALYILGDLFEYWIGDDDDSPLVNQIAQNLKILSQTGTAIYFIQGNRDFLLGKRYAQRCGMTLLPDVTTIDLYGEKTVIMHGDTLCTRDVDYQAFRKKSRSWWWQAMIKSLPLFIRRKIAQNYRKKSAQSTAMKSQDIMDVTPDEVIQCLKKHQSKLLIHGHTHRPATHELTVNGEPAKRIVLGDWYEQGSILYVSNDSITLENMPFSR